MFTAIIADDEYKIAQLISKLVLWDELGIKLIDITDNGSDALDLIQKYTPDIVITDIRMPEIDGLELIRRVKALGIGTKFVVISGYRYFEYAHSALKYGVEDYLIKPIKQDELNEVLSKICKDKLDYIKNQTNQVMIQEELHKSRNALHRELIEKFITDTISDNDLENVNKLYSLDFSEGLFQTITLMLDHKNLDDRNNRQDNLVIEKLLNLTRQHLKPYVIEVLVSAKDEQIICCILNFSKEQKNKVNNELGSLFTAAEDYIYAFNDYEITMGIGSVETLFSKIHNSLDSSMKAMQYRIIVGTRRRIALDNYDFKVSFSANSIIKKYSSLFNNIIDSFDTARLNSTIENIFNDASFEQQANPRIYYDLAIQLIETFFHIMPQDSNETFMQSKNELVKLIPSIYTVKSMVNQLKQKLTLVLKHYEEVQSAKDLKPVREAKQYIDEHYADKIVLEDIARIVNLNPVYFSVIFKKEIGENFSDYLCNVRMEAAKNLLRNEIDNIAVVAEKVGYKDAKYFSQIFTKIVGLKPAQFRKLYS